MKRLALVVTAVAALFALFAPAAFAEGLLGGASEALSGSSGGTDAVSTLSSTVSAATVPVTQAAAPVLETATTEVAKQVVNATVTNGTTPLSSNVAALTAPVTEVAASTLQTVDSAPRSTGAAASTVGSASPATPSTTSPPNGQQPALGTTSPRVPVAPTGGAAATTQPAPTKTTLTVHQVPSRGHPEGFRGLPATATRTLGLPRDPSPATVAGTPSTPRHAGDARGSFHPSLPLPLPDRIPHEILGGASAGATGGALVLLATLAALFVLAAPRPGRRLRPGSAPWPLPVLHLSLERPG